MTTNYEPAAILADRLIRERTVTRIWDRDVSVWRVDKASADARSIAARLGWLDVGRGMTPELDRVTRLGSTAREEGIEAVYLLGMGGSSLCGEVLRSVYGVADGQPELYVLDTTDERTIQTAATRMNPQRTWFLIASKSGETVEVTSLERFFRARMESAVGDAAGRHFIAITDPGTSLQKLAEAHRYRELFLNPKEVGGRFSALSLFGLVPAALIGASAKGLLAAGDAMAEGCRQENHTNAGLELGAFIGATALEGRDKLTVLLPPSLESLGLWIEQLVAESTGKHGKGVLPVVDEPPGRPDEYGTDRAFVAVATDLDAPDARRLDALDEAGHPLLRLTTRLDGIGAEFFRWEFATAVAGAVLGINPFDEPNVSEAKEKTRALLDAITAGGKLSDASPVATAAEIRHALGTIRDGDYVAFLSYLSPSAEVDAAIADLRMALRRRFRISTTHGVGPRYLHSTGQYHKGGPNTAIAFILTAEDDTATPIPGSGYTFSVLKRAQALGDVETLAAHQRRVLHIHFDRTADAASALEHLFAESLQ